MVMVVDGGWCFLIFCSIKYFKIEKNIMIMVEDGGESFGTFCSLEYI